MMRCNRFFDKNITHSSEVDVANLDATRQLHSPIFVEEEEEEEEEGMSPFSLQGEQV